MVLSVVVIAVCVIALSLFLQTMQHYGACTQDQTSSRPNTLADDADDLQRQLDNEARDRFQNGRATSEIRYRGRRFDKDTLSLPKYSDDYPAYGKLPAWDYKGQANWKTTYPSCGGMSQSPVDLPMKGLIPATTGRKMVFCNFNVTPNSMRFTRDGSRIFLTGEWGNNTRPLLHGGVAHSRRYLFHSLVLHTPSEHSVGGLLYPLESQALFFSTDYKDIDDASNAWKNDPQAMLGIVSMYKYATHTQAGLKTLIEAALGPEDGVVPAKPLLHFSPAFSAYACYQGSLPAPPCSEAVLWLVRARTLPVTRLAAEAAHRITGAGGSPIRFQNRAQQRLNDRMIYYFKGK